MDGLSDREVELVTTIRDAKDPAELLNLAVSEITQRLESGDVVTDKKTAQAMGDTTEKRKMLYHIVCAECGVPDLTDEHLRRIEANLKGMLLEEKLQTFTYQSSPVRIIEKEGAPWWVLADVCKVLGLINPSNIAKRLDPDEKGIHQMYTPGGPQNMTIINESGLYGVILRSDKAEAKPFKRWVTHEVLPAIRKTGAYDTSAVKGVSQIHTLDKGTEKGIRQMYTLAETRHQEVIQHLKADCFDIINEMFHHRRA